MKLELWSPGIGPCPNNAVDDVSSKHFPSWDRRGDEPRNEASGVVLKNVSAASLR